MSRHKKNLKKNLCGWLWHAALRGTQTQINTIKTVKHGYNKIKVKQPLVSTCCGEGGEAGGLGFYMPALWRDGEGVFCVGVTQAYPPLPLPLSLALSLTLLPPCSCCSPSRSHTIVVVAVVRRAAECCVEGCCCVHDAIPSLLLVRSRTEEAELHCSAPQLRSRRGRELAGARWCVKTHEELYPRRCYSVIEEGLWTGGAFDHPIRLLFLSFSHIRIFFSLRHLQSRERAGVHMRNSAFSLLARSPWI